MRGQLLSTDLVNSSFTLEDRNNAEYRSLGTLKGNEDTAGFNDVNGSSKALTNSSCMSLSNTMAPLPAWLGPQVPAPKTIEVWNILNQEVWLFQVTKDDTKYMGEIHFLEFSANQKSGILNKKILRSSQ